MEAKIQKMSDEFQQQIYNIQRQVEDTYNANNNKLDQLFSAFQQLSAKLTESNVQGGAGSPSVA